MGEPYRSLLGHFQATRSVTITGTRSLPTARGCRRSVHFGDECADYSEALAVHYKDGPAPDWPDHFISAYARPIPGRISVETWAHYLHVIDALDTAGALGAAPDGWADGFAGADLPPPSRCLFASVDIWLVALARFSTA